MATDEEVLASVKRGKPPVDCAVIGTWKLRSYVRERLSDGQRHNQFGEAPVGYIGYAPDGRMYAIFTRDDRVAPRDVVPTDEEGVQLLGTITRNHSWVTRWLSFESRTSLASSIVSSLKYDSPSKKRGY